MRATRVTVSSHRRTGMSTRTPAVGFTLLEMLVAIAVFAMLSVMSQQVVSGVMQADSISEQQHSELQALQQMMQYLTHDLTQMIPKTVRSGPAGREAALLVGNGVLGSQGVGLRFTRGGVVNPHMMQARSHFTQVGYRIAEGKLERWLWPQTDLDSRMTPQVQVLAPVNALRVQFYDNGRWSGQWSSPQASPQAIRITFDFPQLGTIDRVWLLRGALLPSGRGGRA